MENNFIEWIKKDYIYIVTLLVALITIMYLMGAGQAYQNKCNDYWSEQVQYVIDRCPAYSDNSFNNFTGQINYLYIMEDGKDGNKE